ncbi:MAG: rRNA maturation RNase YbeY [Lachnospiraceae bacterium]|nr:rRNA maturation RNase YbeY [Lachnospiraceae bacterium]
MTDVVYEERGGLSGMDDLDFNPEKIASCVADAVLLAEGCPFEAEVSLTITDDAEIRDVNRENRGIDRATDVLSFPVFGYSHPAAFDEAEEDPAGNFDPESGRLLLGDILISAERMQAQAEEYGHSVRREFAFLVAHSILHLIGYDHETPEEETVMFEKQEAVLTSLGITRDS